MPPVLLLILLGLGALVSFTALVWNLVVCARHGVGWVLAVLFVPFVNLVFLVKFWSEARRPFFLSLAGLALIVAPVMMNPPAFSKAIGDRFALPGKAAGQPPAFANASPAAPPSLGETLQRERTAQEEYERRQRRMQETRTAYEKHRAEADALFKDLNTRRAKLKVDDAKVVAVFNADAARYAALLEQTRTEHDALEAPGTPAAAAVVVAPTSPGKRPPEPAPVTTANTPKAQNPTAGASGDTSSLPRRALDKARVARDAASAAEDAGPFAGEVYGTAPSSPRR